MLTIALIFSSKISGKYAPQGGIEELAMGDDGWVQIRTDKGPKWINMSYLLRPKLLLNVPAINQLPELQKEVQLFHSKCF